MGNRRYGWMVQGVVGGLLASAAVAPVQADELELQPETLKSWNGYVQAALKKRQHQDGPYLSVDRDPEKLARLRAGEIIVWPGCSANPKRVPSGLIHDWIGAAFFPNARIEDVIAVGRDYQRYASIYKPGILDAHLLSQQPLRDDYTLLIKNSSFFTKTALDGEFQTDYTRIDDTHWFIYTHTIRLQEIDDYGEAAQHKLPPDRGSGYIWRMSSLTRMEERDGGVYVEEEVLGLSRDVPMCTRWVIMPIIRRVARESTAASISKTRAALKQEQAKRLVTRNAMACAAGCYPDPAPPSSLGRVR